MEDKILFNECDLSHLVPRQECQDGQEYHTSSQSFFTTILPQLSTVEFQLDNTDFYSSQLHAGISQEIDLSLPICLPRTLRLGH